MSVTLSQDDSAQQLHDTPGTLADAHDVLWRQRPPRDADPMVWIAFHRRSAIVYVRVAAVDTARRSEAQQCAGMEIRKAREIEHRLNPEDDDT